MKARYLSLNSAPRAAVWLVWMVLPFALAPSAPAQAQGQVRGAIEYPPLDILDPAKGEEISPIQRAAERLSHREERRQRRSLAHIQNLITYDYELEGANEKEIMDEAMLRALKAAAARLYADDYLIVGRDLLEPYLRQSGQPAIARTTPLERRILAGDRLWMRVRVSVNLDVLYPDLDEKRFLDHPNLRPTIAVVLEENIESLPGLEAAGRQRVEQMMEAKLFRPFSRELRQTPLDIDLTADSGQLRAARLEAQRFDIDVLITGKLDVRPIRTDEILYDEYHFQDAQLRLAMYRVDTGEVITETTDRYSAAGETAETAVTRVLDAMVLRSAERLAVNLMRTWPRTILDQTDYRLLLNRVDPEDVAGIRLLLESFSPDVEIYQKAHYGEVAVMNLVLPQTTPDKLEQFLREARRPQFLVRKVNDRLFELQPL